MDRHADGSRSRDRHIALNDPLAAARGNEAGHHGGNQRREEREGVPRGHCREQPADRAAERRELEQTGHPAVEVVHHDDRPAGQDRGLKRPVEVGNVPVHEQRQAEQDGVERVEIQPEVFDEKMVIDPGRQCGDQDRHRYRAPLDPVREGRNRRGMVDRFRFSDHEERLGKLERVGKLGERLGTARVQESRSDDDGEEERHDEDEGGRRPDRGRQRHQTDLLLEEMARRIHQERCARREPELPDRPGRRRRGEQEWKINRDPLFLRLAGKVDRHQRAERDGEPPVEIRQARDHQAGQREHLVLGPWQAGEPGDRLPEHRRRAEGRAQHENQRHLHRERQQHPEAAIERVHDGCARIADRKGRDAEQQQHADRRGHGVRNDSTDGLRKTRQPVGRNCRRCVDRRHHSGRSSFYSVGVVVEIPEDITVDRGPRSGEL